MALNNLFSFPKSFHVLLFIKNVDGCYALKISKRLNITYCHIFSIIKSFERLNLINKKKVGRRYVLSLTKKGLEIASLFEELKKKLVV